MKKRYGLGRPERIRRNFEYKKARKKGTSYRDGVFVMTVLKNDRGCHRLGVSIGASKVPLAVDRNRIKRVIKEVFRRNKPRLKNGPYDIAVMCLKPLPYKRDYPAIEKRFLDLLKRAGIYD